MSSNFSYHIRRLIRNEHVKSTCVRNSITQNALATLRLSLNRRVSLFSRKNRRISFTCDFFFFFSRIWCHNLVQFIKTSFTASPLRHLIEIPLLWYDVVEQNWWLKRVKQSRDSLTSQHNGDQANRVIMMRKSRESWVFIFHFVPKVFFRIKLLDDDEIRLLLWYNECECECDSFWVGKCRKTHHSRTRFIFVWWNAASSLEYWSDEIFNSFSSCLLEI